MTHHAIRFSEITARQAYKVMIGTVVPRPIAWVTTVSPDGVVNAAPYSFFNCLSADPAILALGVENKPDRSFKDTASNIRHTEIFTVNIVDVANVETMAATAAPFDPDVDELKMAGLTAIDGVALPCPRIAEAPVAFECRRHLSIAVSNAREIILGRIEMAHGYSMTRQIFDLPIPSAEEVFARHQGDRTATGTTITTKRQTG